MQHLWLLSLFLLSACGEKRSPATAPRTTAPSTPSFAPALLRTGLVADRHRRWLLFADTTRQEGFRLGRTPEQVRNWLIDYQERLEEGWTLHPDSVAGPHSTAAERPPRPMLTVIRLPDTPAAQARARRQTILLTHQLWQAGLLTPAQYRRTLPLATAGEFYSRRNLLITVNALAQAAEQLQQSHALPPMLLQIGLLTKLQAHRLAQDLRAGVFTDPVELLPRLPHARIFTRHQYPAAMRPYLEQLHRDVAHLLPGLQFTHFQAQLITPSQLAPCFNCPDEQDVLVQLQIGSRHYAHRSHWGPGYRLTGGNWPQIEDQFYHLFNQALVDQGSAYRLVLVPSEQTQHTIGGQARFGLWRLTARQAEALDTLVASALPLEDYQSYRILPTDTVTAALRSFAALGFLRHLRPAQRRAAETRLYQARLQTREQVLQFMPGSVGEYRGDPYYRSWSYARLLQVLRDASQGRFAPSQVDDGCQQAEGTLRFRWGSRTYQTRLYEATESPDPRLFQLVQRALREQRIPGTFYQVSSGLAQAQGVVVNYVFLSPAQERTIRRKGLLDLTDPTLSNAERYAQEEAAALAADSIARSGR